MAKAYEISQEVIVDDEQKTVTISETKEVTTERRISIAQLREQHASILINIEQLKAQADVIVDEMTSINTGLTEITITEIPSKEIIAIAK